MVRWKWIISLIVSGCFLVSSVSAQQVTPTPPLPDEFTTQTDPASLVGAYYNAISRGDYARAYGYWEQAPNNQTEAEFAAGFADTASANVLVRLPIFIDAGAGNLYASLPTLVIGNRVDGSTEFYTGCFIAHKTNVPVGDAPEPDPNWYLQEGDLRQIQTPDLAALDTACAETYTLTTDPNSVVSQLDPIQLVGSYFSLIARGQSGDALALWENPPGDLFQAAYGQVINAAESFNVYVNPVAYREGAAGSIYTSVPVLVVMHNADNMYLYLSITGCYVARLSNVPVGDAEAPDPNWHFYDTSLNLVADTISAMFITSESCAQ